MSSKIVQGKHVDVYEWSDPDEYLIICAKSCTLRRSFEKIETTHWSSDAREFTTGMYDWGITLEGLVTIQQINPTDKTAFDYLTYGGSKTIRMRFTDDDGNQKIIEGAVIFPDMTITGDVSSASAYTMELQGSGTLTVS